MSQLFTAGPALFWVGLNTPSVVPGPSGFPVPYGNDLNTDLAVLTRTPYFLGTCKQPPRIEITIGKKDVPNDIGGSEIAFDKLKLGRKARTTAILNKINMDAALALEAANVFGGTPGIDLFGDIGALSIQEQYCFALWIVFPYANKAAMAGQPFGYHFPFTELDEESLEGLGTDCREWPFVFESLRGFTPPTLAPGAADIVGHLAGVAAPAGSFYLYDFNMAGLPGLGLAFN